MNVECVETWVVSMTHTHERQRHLMNKCGNNLMCESVGQDVLNVIMDIAFSHTHTKTENHISVGSVERQVNPHRGGELILMRKCGKTPAKMLKRRSGNRCVGTVPLPRGRKRSGWKLHLLTTPLRPKLRKRGSRLDGLHKW